MFCGSVYAFNVTLSITEQISMPAWPVDVWQFGRRQAFLLGECAGGAEGCRGRSRRRKP